MTDEVLDTTFFIDLYHGVNPEADALWQALKAGDKTAAVSPITLYELWVGGQFSRTEEMFYESILLVLEEVGLSGNAARQAGLWLRNWPGRAEGLVRDALIAATAFERDEPVITANLRDFQRLAGVKVEPYKCRYHFT